MIILLIRRGPETLILNILNHLLNIQSSNAEPFTRLVTSNTNNVYFQVWIQILIPC